MTDKIRIGNGKKQKENWLKSSLCLSNIPKEHIFEYEGKKYIKVDINIFDEPNQFGKDVSITVDTWKPGPKGNVETQPQQNQEDDDLPF